MNQIGQNIYENFTDLMPLDLHGWNGNVPIFAELLKKIKPKVIVEVGTWKGLSAINMANNAKRLGLNCKIYCVDTWLGALEFWDWLKDTPERNLMLKNGYPQIYYQFLSNVIHCGHQDIIIPVPLPSSIAVKLLRSMNIRADLIYIDGSHEEEDVYRDICDYQKILSAEGIIFGDDYDWHQVKNAIIKYQSDTKSEISVIGGHWLIKKLGYDTSTALVPQISQI